MTLTNAMVIVKAIYIALNGYLMSGRAYMTHREDIGTPAWVDQLNEDVIMKDADDASWYIGGYNGMPTRFHSEGKYINAYDNGYHRKFHDETSLRSRSTVSSRHRRNTCCLIVFLVFAALLVAIGIGLMVYYLLRPDGTKYQARIANGSLPLLNVPYTQDMMDPNSESFKNIEKALCKEIDTSFRKSAYADQYEYCKIESLRLDDTPLPCACSNITSPLRSSNVRAYINFGFGEEMFKDDVQNIIEKQIRRIYGVDYDVLMLDDYVIDIASHVVTTTIKPIPDSGVRASLTIWVYNLTYTTDLADSSSDNFKTLAGPFCNDLRRIFLMSTLKSRYYSCQVKEFRDDPDIVNTDVWFTGTDVFGLPTSVKKIVLDNARKVNVSNTIRKMIGTLLITPKTGNDSNVSVITIPVNPETTISPTPSTRPPKWKDGMPYVETLMNFTGVDYNVSLWDTNSDFFMSHANKFCKSLERLIMQSSWKKHFYDCNLVNIYPPASGQFYPTLRTVVHVNSNIRTPDELIDIIKTYGDKYIFPGNLETYRVGDLYVILKDGRFDIYSSIYGTDVTIEYPTKTMTLMPSVFTTFSFSSPTMTPGDTVKPPVSTIVIVYNATAAFIENELVDFNYTPELDDTTSARFLSIEEYFCEDIDRFFMSSSLQMYYKNCKISGFTSDPKLSFVLQFTAPKGKHLQSTVPSVLVQKAPKLKIRQMTVLKIGDLNLLYEQIGFTVSVTNFTFDMTPTISPTGTIVVPSTKIPVEYTAALLNIFCDVGMDISGVLQDKNSQVFILLQKEFCSEVRRLFSRESTTADSYLDCYVMEFRSDTSTVNFHTIFGTDATEALGHTAIDVIHRLANKVIHQQVERLDIGGVVIEKDSCSMNVYPVNYTDPQTTVFPTLTPTSQIILPTIGPDHCLRNPCRNGGTCVDQPSSYYCSCVSGFSGLNCEIVVPVDGGWSPWSTWTTCTATCGRGTQDRFRTCTNPVPKNNGKVCLGSALDLRDCNTQLCPDIDECKIMSDACENGGTCRNKQDGYECICYPGYIGERCETVVDRCASNPCKNGASCTGSQARLCVCTSGWSGETCEDDEDECKHIPNICKFNGTCINEFGTFRCDCVDGRTGPTCNEGIDECTTIGPCQNNAQCLDTDYSYTCVCKSGWTGKNCTEDEDECTEDICENGGTCKNTIGSFECTCPSGWTGQTCDLRYNECKGLNPCLNDGLCVDTTIDFRCICKPEYTGKFCETDVNECIEDPNICNGHGVCENLNGGFKCICEFEWEGERCDFDHNECTDTSLGQLCYNNGECINQWGSYKCKCEKGWTGVDCKTDKDECADTPPICLHNGACTNTDGGYNCTCSSGWTGDRCQIDVDECNTTFPCQNNATCTNKVGSFLCTCTSGWKGLLCTTDRNECVETPGICRNGGTCYNEEGDYRCDCPAGRGGKNCDYSTDPCNDIVCAHGGTCYIDSNGDAKCDCTELFQGENCEEDFDECTQNPCSKHGTCINLPGTFYCECDIGFTGDYCEIDEDECTFFPCVNGDCVNTPGSFYCDCYAGWTGLSCNVDKSECSLLTNPCNGNGRCKETPGSYRCFCYFGFEGQFCQNDVNECVEIQCENGGVCWNLPGGYQCNCTQHWTGPFCTIDLNECTTHAAPCLNGGTCRNRKFGYDCSCPSPWTGPTCNEDVNECTESPGLCQNGGTCVNGPGNFRCDCTDGYMGEYCQIDKNECITTKPCMNGATCKNIDGSYECICPRGFEGMNCEKDINECLDDPCKNGATCLNSPPGDYRCTCTDELKGKNCEIEIERCPDCENGGTCVEENNDFRCACPAGWEGDVCQNDINECDINSDLCINGATCKNEEGDYMCECLHGFGGKNCENDLDDCSPNPCLFGGTCIDGINSYTCRCPPGRIGVNCQRDEDECQTVPSICKNGATCSNTIGSFECRCTDYWQGDLCNIDKNECLTVRCLHGGTCNNTIGSFYCENCDEGWEGQLCDKDKNECPNVQCLHGGTCFNIDGSYFCDNCDEGWEGQRCEIDRNECPSVRCMHGGTCVNTDGSYYCDKCNDGWQGQLCDEDKNECSTIQCMHGGTCVNTDGSFYCKDCDEGWEGQLCDTDKNECPNIQCLHGGTCFNIDGSYFCDNCNEGWEGQRCEIDINECPSVRCLHGGTCVNTDGSYYCDNCDDGWQGQLCDEDKNECSTIQCMHGGTCVNTDGSFYCKDCDEGWEGQLCDRDIDECMVSMGTEMLCKNGASCLNLDGSYLCICKAQYQGPDCSEDKDECSLSPPICENGGTCTNTIGFFNCDCTDFWMGEKCDIDVNECVEFGSLACNGNGVCNNTIGNYLCNCSAEFTGERCDQDKNECEITPPICLNGGTCNNYFGSYDCDCDAGFDGPNCGKNKNECSLGVCLNAVSCEDTFGSYKCTCENGWTGPNCDTDINECNDNLCMNGATCSNSAGSVECICVDGWEGLVCDKDINECLTVDICKNGATCQNEDGSYMCICAPGWEGTNCTIDLNECLTPNLCKNGATCENNDGSYTCLCSSGWEGQMCDTDINECLTEDICKNGATCQNKDGGYMCNCAPGWEGPKCTIDINECLTPDLCKNGATCENNDGSYTCLCSNGWEGQMCDMDINECLTVDICKNGATCQNKDGGYMCICGPGWEGQNCNIDINECLTPDLCKNGATCDNNDGSYTCLCSNGWEGQMCDIDKDECLMVGTCENGATCVNTDGSYTCTCASGWEGQKCGTDINECPDICQNGGFCRNTPGSFNCTCIGDWTGPTCELVGGKTFELDFETVGLIITPTLLDKQSDQFLRKQDILCHDIGKLVAERFLPYEGCRIKSFVENPAGLTLQLTFDADQPDDLGSDITDMLFEIREKERFGDVYGIRVGDMVFKHSDFISTTVTMNKRLINFTYSNTLSDENSLNFQRYENAFCTQVNQLMTASATLFPDFIECDIIGFSYDPNNDETNVEFSFEFEGTKDVARMKSNFDEHLNSNLQLVRFDRYEAVMFGDFYIYIRDLPNFTKVPLSYKLLDVSWNGDLANNQSTLFSEQSRSFCNAMESLIKQHSQYAGSLDRCSVQTYSDYDFVTVNFTMDYFEVLDIPMIQSEISNIIYNFTQRERYLDQYIGYRVEDLILYDSIATYYEVPYDSWIANFTFSLFDYSSYKETLTDSSSEDFKEKQKAFCNGDSINEFQGMNPEIQKSSVYGPRLLRCFVHSYTFDEFSLTDKLTSTVSLLFLGIEPIFAQELMDIISDSFAKFTVGSLEEYYFIGYDLVLMRGVDEIKVNKSNYIVDITTTTPKPEIVDTLPMRFPLYNFTFNNDYLNTSSDLYKNHQELFCFNMSFLLRKGDNELPRFGDCGNMKFTMEGGTPYLTFEIGFLDKIENPQSTVDLILLIILEKAKRINIVPTEEEPGLSFAAVIGPFMVYHDMLTPQKTNPNLFSSTPSP